MSSSEISESPSFPSSAVEIVLSIKSVEEDSTRTSSTVGTEISSSSSDSERPISVSLNTGSSSSSFSKSILSPSSRLSSGFDVNSAVLRMLLNSSPLSAIVSSSSVSLKNPVSSSGDGISRDPGISSATESVSS